MNLLIYLHFMKDHTVFYIMQSIIIETAHTLLNVEFFKKKMHYENNNNIFL